MAVVSSEVEVQKSPSQVAEEWKSLPLYLNRVDRFDEETVVDVLKLTSRTQKLKNAPLPSLSNAVWQAKDELTKDPFNMRKINNLGFMYLRDGQHDQCLNVLMRGWKRSSEIPEEPNRFRYLMKASELSFGLWKFRQALTIFRDIIEPSDPGELKSYLILGVQVWASNGDVTQALKFFQRAVEGEEFRRAVRVFAIVSTELKKAGAYEAARSTIENMANGGTQAPCTDLGLIDSFIEGQEKRKEKVTPEQMQRWITFAGVGFGSFVLLMILYWLESRSLAAMEWK